MNKFNQARSQGGFSLIELLLVLAIVAALAVAAFIVYPRVQAGRNASYEAQVLSSAQAGVKALFTTNNYSKLSTTTAVNAELFPSNMNVSPTEIQNQWGGAVTAGSVSSSGGDVGNTLSQTGTGISRHFGFRYESVPTDVCIRLAGAAVQNFGKVIVGTTVVQDLFSTSTLPGDDTDPARNLDESLIASSCRVAGGASITFISN